LYDRDHLYFAVSAKDSEADHLIVTELRKDFTAENGDALIIALDTFHDERNAYQFAINPAGASCLVAAYGNRQSDSDITGVPKGCGGSSARLVHTRTSTTLSTATAGWKRETVSTICHSIRIQT
jgi:hypothetical protein